MKLRAKIPQPFLAMKIEALDWRVEVVRYATMSFLLGWEPVTYLVEHLILIDLIKSHVCRFPSLQPPRNAQTLARSDILSAVTPRKPSAFGSC